MGNISNNEEEPLYDGLISNGVILNIENVLNQLNQNNELSKDQNEQLQQYLNSS